MNNSLKIAAKNNNGIVSNQYIGSLVELAVGVSYDVLVAPKVVLHASTNACRLLQCEQLVLQTHAFTEALLAYLPHCLPCM